MATYVDFSTVVEDLVEQSMGKEALDTLDLTNIASLGDHIVNSLSEGSNDIIFSSLLDRIGKTVIANRIYNSKFGFLGFDPFEYGFLLQKIHVALVAPQDSGKYYNGTDTDENLRQFGFYNPTIRVTLFSNAKAWEFPLTISREQIKSAFKDEASLSAFITGIFVAMDSSINKAFEDTARAVLAAYMGELLVFQAAADTAGETMNVAVNVAQMYYDETGEVVADNWAYDPAFCRYLTGVFTDYKGLLTNETVLFNAQGLEKHTPESELRFVIIGKVAANIKRFMQSDTYHKDLVEMPGYNEVDYWQSLGDMSVSARSSINATLPSTHDESGTAVHDTIEASNVIGVMYDRYAVGVTLYDRDTAVVPLLRTKRTNYFEQAMVGNFIDTGEQGVVFYVGEVTVPPSP